MRTDWKSYRHIHTRVVKSKEHNVQKSRSMWAPQMKVKWLNRLYTHVHMCSYLYACINDNYEDMNFEGVGGISRREGKLASDGKAILIHEIHWKTLKITSLNEKFINLISSELSTSSVKLLRNIVLHITILLSLLTCCTKQIYFIFINMCQYFYFT